MESSERADVILDQLKGLSYSQAKKLLLKILEQIGDEASISKD